MAVSQVLSIIYLYSKIVSVKLILIYIIQIVPSEYSFHDYMNTLYSNSVHLHENKTLVHTLYVIIHVIQLFDGSLNVLTEQEVRSI